MKPNPGGQQAPENIVGRDGLIEGFWQVLEQQSIYLNDLRRIGKTQIMVKMHAQPRPGWTSIKRDLGGCHTAAEFAELAYADSIRVLPKLKRTGRQVMTILRRLQGSELPGGVKLSDPGAPTWKELLRSLFADLDQAMKDEDGRIVLFWDEVPFLLDNIVRREGKEQAMEVLDLLRSLGQDHDHVRAFLTGSIGLHHILEELRADHYNGSPLNRMKGVEAGPLSPVDGLKLAMDLLEGAKVGCADRAACAEAITTSVGHVPFYIHKLVACLPTTGSVTPDLIDRTLDVAIRNPKGDWDLEHYRHRIGKYYAGAEARVLAILDGLAVEEPLDFAALRKVVGGSVASSSDEELRRTIRLLILDHYLVRDDGGRYSFYLGIVRRWWRLDRDLQLG